MWGVTQIRVLERVAKGRLRGHGVLEETWGWYGVSEMRLGLYGVDYMAVTLDAGRGSGAGHRLPVGERYGVSGGGDLLGEREPGIGLGL